MVLRQSTQALILSLLLTFFLWTFALFIHTPFPAKGLAAASLLLSAFCISTVLKRNPEVYLGLSLWQWRRSLWLVVFLSLVASLVLAAYYRSSIQLPWHPTRFGGFVMISIMIGCCEEIIFRGFVQGEAGRWNKEAAVVLGSLSHAGYKSFLFVLPAQLIDMSLQRLFVLTFVVGLVLGFARYRSGSLLPCLLAHGFFDLWVYAEVTEAPWWVW